MAVNSTVGLLSTTAKILTSTEGETADGLTNFHIYLIAIGLSVVVGIPLLICLCCGLKALVGSKKDKEYVQKMRRITVHTVQATNRRVIRSE